VRIISSETGYGIIADENKVYVNGGSDESLGTPVLVLHVCMYKSRIINENQVFRPVPF
jgi:hypothetical protein